jgi:hypothetical protein
MMRWIWGGSAGASGREAVLAIFIHDGRDSRLLQGSNWGDIRVCRWTDRRSVEEEGGGWLPKYRSLPIFEGGKVFSHFEIYIM